MSETPSSDDGNSGLDSFRRRRNIFENNDAPEPPVETESSKSSADDKRSLGKVHSGKGIPCIVGACRCICEHNHDYDRDNAKYGTPQVQVSHLHCPIHGKTHSID